MPPRRPRWRSRALPALGLALAALTPSAAAASIVNIEARRPALETEREDGWQGAVALKFSFTSGNINILDLGLNATANYLRGRHTLLSLGDYSIATKTDPKQGGGLGELRSPDSVFRHTALGHLRYAYRALDWLALEAYTQISTNQIILLRLRYLAGLGPRFVLFKDAHFGAFLSTSYYAEYERLNPMDFLSQPGDRPPVNWWHRWSTALTLRLRASENLLMTNISYAQPRLDAVRDLYYLNDSVIEVKAGEHVSFLLSLQIRWDSAPPTYCTTTPDPGADCPIENVYDVRPTDVRLENALAVSF